MTKGVTLAATAAVAMMAASPANAVRWVQYTLTGSGLMTSTHDDLQGRLTTTYVIAVVRLSGTVDADVTPSADGTRFYQTYGWDSKPVLQSATFTPTTLSASSSVSSADYSRGFWGSWTGSGGTMGMSGRAGRGFTGYTSFNLSATVFDFAVQEVAAGGGGFSFQTLSTSPAPAPEPATWGLMLMGFGMVGTGLRRRRAGIVLA